MSRKSKRQKRENQGTPPVGEKSWKFVAAVQWARTPQTGVESQRVIDRDKDQRLASAPALLAQVTPFGPEAATWMFRTATAQQTTDELLAARPRQADRAHADNLGRAQLP